MDEIGSVVPIITHHTTDDHPLARPSNPMRPRHTPSRRPPTASVDDGECHCPCHGNPNILHAVACCGVCPTCGMSVRTNRYDEHVRTCDRHHEDEDEEEEEECHHCKKKGRGLTSTQMLWIVVALIAISLVVTLCMPQQKQKPE